MQTALCCRSISYRLLVGHGISMTKLIIVEKTNTQTKNDVSFCSRDKKQNAKT